MLAFALRRAIWAIPTLFGVSLVVFFLTTLLPEPEGPRAGTLEVAERLARDELRRARFLDLPRFFNATPRDVRAAVEECMIHIVLDDAEARMCEARLSRLGGAALPHLLPRLDDLPPTSRGRVAVALAPVARRMGLGDADALAMPETATLFWRRFWADRSVDFTEPSVRRSVQRLTSRESALLERELRLVDTFALPELIAALRQRPDPAALVRLTRVASHVTDRASELAPVHDAATARAVVSDWLSWWHVHELDYVALQGEARLSASVAQTRYAKWVLGAVTGRLGLSTRDGLPIFDKLRARAPLTLGIAALALLLSVLVAVPLGVVAAWRRGEGLALGAAALLVVLHGLPTFLVAELLFALAGPRPGVVLPVLALAPLSLSVMTQQQRSSMIDALAQDYVRAARAKGARPLRVALVHALRNALIPTVTVAGGQLPVLLGGAFVMEEVFEVRGLGWETLRAIESHDVAWIVVVTLLCAVVTIGAHVVTELAYGLVDPRVRELQAKRGAS